MGSIAFHWFTVFVKCSDTAGSEMVQAISLETSCQFPPLLLLVLVPPFPLLLLLLLPSASALGILAGTSNLQPARGGGAGVVRIRVIYVFVALGRLLVAAAGRASKVSCDVASVLRPPSQIKARLVDVMLFCCIAPTSISSPVSIEKRSRTSSAGFVDSGGAMGQKEGVEGGRLSYRHIPRAF